MTGSTSSLDRDPRHLSGTDARYTGEDTMTDSQHVPPFEIVRVENASFAAAKRLRVYVAIDPADIDQAGSVAAEVVAEHAANNDMVMMFFHFNPEAAGKDPAEVRAQYIRSGMKQGFHPGTLKSHRDTIEVETQNGVITVEKTKQA